MWARNAAHETSILPFVDYDILKMAVLFEDWLIRRLPDNAFKTGEKADFPADGSALCYMMAFHLAARAIVRKRFSPLLGPSPLRRCDLRGRLRR